MTVELNQLQNIFARAVTIQEHDDLQTFVVSDDKGTVAERLHIYEYAYQSRLREVLSVDFPGLKSLLGDNQFHEMVQTYVGAYPSDQPSIRWVGRHLAVFLAATSPYSEQPMLSEMAAFEWAQGETFDAADSKLATLQDLFSLAPEQWGTATLKLIPSLRRLDLVWNVPQIWQAIENDNAPFAPIKVDKPTAWAIWRKDLKTHWRSLESDEAELLDSALRGSTIAELCETLCQWLDEEQIPGRIVAILQTWLNDAMVAEIQLNK